MDERNVGINELFFVVVTAAGKKEIKDFQTRLEIFCLPIVRIEHTNTMN